VDRLLKMPALAADYVRAGSETTKYLPPLHDGHKRKATIVTTSKMFALRLRPYISETSQPSPPLISEAAPAQRAGTTSLLMMDVVTSRFIADRNVAVASAYTPVSGPHGPLTRRYAPATANALP